MSTPLVDALGRVYSAPGGTPVSWRSGVGYDSLGRMCTTTVQGLFDVASGAWRLDPVGRVVVSATPTATALIENPTRDYVLTGPALPPDVTYTHASIGTFIDSAGVMRTALANEARFDHGNVRTNFIRNSEMVGAAAPSTFPNLWTFFTPLTGLTTTVTPVTVGGIKCIDVRSQGVASGAGVLSVFPENRDLLLFPVGTSMTTSAQLAMPAGTLSNVTNVVLRMMYYLGAVYVNESNTIADTSFGANLQSYAVPGAVIPGSDRVAPVITIYVAAAGPIDITLRIAMPQLEMGSAVTAYIPTTGTAASSARPLGIWSEEARTNGIRNSVGAGAVVGVIGSGGAAPTNWFMGNAGTGLTRTVVGTGIENGIPYTDFRFSGAAVAAGAIQIGFEGVTVIAALTGQTWSASLYARLVAGDYTNVSALNLFVNEYATGAVFVKATITVLTPITAGLLIDQRKLATSVLSGGATTAFVSFVIQATAAIGPVDFTLRLGYPQLEQAAMSSTVIPTTGAALTRATDNPVVSGAAFSAFFNQTEGTLEVDFDTPVAVGAGTATGPLAVDDGTGNNAYEFGANNATGGLAANIYAGGAYQGVNSVGSTTNFVPAKVALAYKANNSQMSANGLVGPVDTTVTLPIVNIMRIGKGRGVFALGYLNGHVSRVRYYATRLSGSELGELTGPLAPVHNGGIQFDTTTGAMIVSTDAVPAAGDPYVHGMRVDNTGRVYLTTASPP